MVRNISAFATGLLSILLLCRRRRILTVFFARFAFLSQSQERKKNLLLWQLVIYSSQVSFVFYITTLHTSQSACTCFSWKGERETTSSRFSYEISKVHKINLSNLYSVSAWFPPSPCNVSCRRGKNDGLSLACTIFRIYCILKPVFTGFFSFVGFIMKKKLVLLILKKSFVFCPPFA